MKLLIQRSLKLLSVTSCTRYMGSGLYPLWWGLTDTPSFRLLQFLSTMFQEHLCSYLMLDISVCFCCEKKLTVETKRNNAEAWHCQDNCHLALRVLQFAALFALVQPGIFVIFSIANFLLYITITTTWLNNKLFDLFGTNWLTDKISADSTGV